MDKSSIIEIELQKYLSNVGEILSGRDTGQIVRKKSNLENEEKKYSKVIIILPENIIGINPSFFLGFLGDSVRNCSSKDAFLEKFKIIYDIEKNPYLIEDIEDGIERALKEGGLLSDSSTLIF